LISLIFECDRLATAMPLSWICFLFVMSAMNRSEDPYLACMALALFGTCGTSCISVTTKPISTTVLNEQTNIENMTINARILSMYKT
jgi:hypothetical protein